MVLDKALQKSLGFEGQTMNAHVTMSSEELEPAGKKREEPVAVSRGMDVLAAIKTRQSIRKFASRPVRGRYGYDNTLLWNVCAYGEK